MSEGDERENAAIYGERKSDAGGDVAGVRHEGFG